MSELNSSDIELELFELELLGGSVEKKYRQMRPEVEEMPWGTLNPKDYPPHIVAAARKSWTGAAYQEFRTGAACAATVRALIEARAPIDLIALASRFPLDEMVHVELCQLPTHFLPTIMSLIDFDSNPDWKSTENQLETEQNPTRNQTEINKKSTEA